MRALIRAAALAAMLLLPTLAQAWYQGETTATIANLATFTGAGRPIANGSSASVIAYVQFTTAATGGTVDVNIDLSADGSVWVLGAATFQITCTGANTYFGTTSLAAGTKAPKARIRLTNNLTAVGTKTATNVFLGFIVN